MSADRLIEAIEMVNAEAKALRARGWSVDLSSGYETVSAYLTFQAPSEVRASRDMLPPRTAEEAQDAKNGLK